MRRILFSCLAVMALSASTMTLDTRTAEAADLYLKNNSADAEKATPKLYLTPGPQSYIRKKAAPNNTATRNAPTGTGPTYDVARNASIDEIQRLNIEGARESAVRNQKYVEQMQKEWDARRVAADEAQTAAGEKKEREAYQQQVKDKKLAEGGNPAKDLVYKSDDPKSGLKKPARIFNIFE